LGALLDKTLNLCYLTYQYIKSYDWLPSSKQQNESGKTRFTSSERDDCCGGGRLWSGRHKDGERSHREGRMVMKKKLIYGVIVVLFLCVVVSLATQKPEEETTPVAATATSVPAAALPEDTPKPKATAVPPTDTPIPPTPTPVPAGLNRLNPIPMDQPIVADNNIELTVLGLERNAWPKIHEANMFNEEPGEGMEYIVVVMKVSYLGDPNETKLVSSWDFRVVGDRGAIYQSASVVLDDKLDAELFGGGAAEGELAFEVTSGEGGLVLIYDSGFGTEARYLSLEQ